MTPTDLKAWRARMGYTQRTAAQAMGVSYQTYVALEQGWRTIQPYHAKLIRMRGALIAALPAVEREAMRLLLTIPPDEMAEGKTDGATAIVDLVKAALGKT